MIDGAYESVDAVLRRRGHRLIKTGNVRDIILPLDGSLVPSAQTLGTAFRLLGKASFRKVARKIIYDRATGTVMKELESIAGPAAALDYADFLESIGVINRSEEGVQLKRRIDNFGFTLEWYVAELCRRELHGSAESLCVKPVMQAPIV